MNNIMRNINVSLTIPGTRVSACAMDVMHDYEPILKQALEEVRDELKFNEEFNESVKVEIKEKVTMAIRDGIQEAANRIVRDAYLKSYPDIEGIIQNELLKKLGLKENINN